MTTSLLADAFAHHVWATQRLLDACIALDSDRLQTAVPGTYGSILKTQRHLDDDGAAWSRLLAQDLDPDAALRDVDDDGGEQQATMGVRLAQALHHGSDHRSQICTALSALGVEPPAIDVWDYGLTVGRVVEVPPTS